MQTRARRMIFICGHHFDGFAVPRQVFERFGQRTAHRGLLFFIEQRTRQHVLKTVDGFFVMEFSGGAAPGFKQGNQFLRIGQARRIRAGFSALSDHGFTPVQTRQRLRLIELKR